MARCGFEVGLYCGDVCLKAQLRDDFGIDGGSIWVVNEWESGVFFRISGDFGEFYNCLTIYYWYWLKDILMVCRSDCRSGFMNCVEIWCNFGDVVKCGV